MNRVMLSAFLAFTLCAATAASSEELFIRNATLYTMSGEGVIENGNVLVRKGMITAVGAQVRPPDGVTVIDATGKTVTPGLINSFTHLGLVEIERVSHSSDFVTTDPGYSASFCVAPAVNPMSTLIPVIRSHGVTLALAVPYPGHDVFAGQGAVIRLVEAGSPMVDHSIAVFATYGSSGGRYTGGSRATAYAKMREAFADAREYQKHRRLVQRGTWRQLSLPPRDLEVLVSVLEGEKPLVVTVHRASDIVAMLNLSEEFSLRLVIAGASEAWMVVDAIADAKVPVILDPLQNIPITFDHLGARLDAAARLRRAGVTVLFAGVDYVKTHRAFFIRQAAGNAVAHGMPRMDAIAAITINPATVFGMGDEFGSIEVGKQADLVVWSGDPLELLTIPEQVIIEGKVSSGTTRSTRLRERYRELHSDGSFLYRK